MLLKSLVFLVLTTLLVAGCGGGSADNATGVSKLAQSQKCMAATCHARSVSPGTDALIVQEWMNSTHNLNNGAGCADCHEPHPGHPESCAKCHGGGSGVATQNPDAAQKCYKCHGLSHPNDIQVRLAPQHFGNMTASTNNSTYRASYLSSNYIGNCRKCHNPHDPTTAMAANAEWADSGHGDVLARARTGYEFKTRGSYEPVNLTFQYYCVRCHTSTGYIKFVASGFSDIAPFAGPGYAVVQTLPGKSEAVSKDKTKEVTACDVCHDNGAGRAYNWATRAVPAYRGYYNFSSTNSSPTIKLNNKAVPYPDVTASNLCIPCHSGRGLGSMIYDAQAAGMDFTNTSQPGAHDRAAATVIFRTGGYEFNGRNYESSSHLHRYIGVGNQRGTGNAGPCVSCHMKGQATHSFLPVTTDSTGSITGMATQFCTKCHDGSFRPAWDAASLQAKKHGYMAALAMLNLLRYQPNTTKMTYKYPTIAPNKNPNWDLLSHGNGANTMGAAFNYGLLANEPGAFAHNSLYARRLIYDSIDWLNDGALNDDVVGAINGVQLVPYYSTSQPPKSYQGQLFLASPFNSAVLLIGYQSQLDANSLAIFAQLKVDAINYLLGPNGGRP